MDLKTIARIHTGFPEKFGIPRQSGIVETPGYIVFEPPYNNPDAEGGFAHKVLDAGAEVVFNFDDEDDGSENCLNRIKPKDLELIKELLAQDPRPRYQDDPERVYGMSYGEWEVKFTAGDGAIIVKSIKNR